jgi:hypothetical protein
MMAEALFFRYHRSDGVRVGVDVPEEVAEFDLDPTPRVTIGWIDGTGSVGVRARGWEFDHNADVFGPGEDDSSVQVDTYNLDLEGFEVFALNHGWTLEISAGVRYNHFVEQLVDVEVVVNGDPPVEVRRNLFHGFGGIVGAEARRALDRYGAVWARARAGILMDDKLMFNDVGALDIRLTDVVLTQTEVAFGYDWVTPLYGGSYFFVRTTAEWQSWTNFSSNFDEIDDDETFEGHSDVGFGGFGLAVGVAR